MNQSAIAGRAKADREAREKTLESRAAMGEPAITPMSLEKARLPYGQALEMARLVREGIAEPNLTIDQRTARVRGIVEGIEHYRLEYEHKRSLFEAQQQRATEKSNRRLAAANLAVAAAVMVAVFVQAVVGWLQYKSR